MKKLKILVRVTNWIGDVVMNIPALEQLRLAYPDAEIVVIARPWVSDVFSFRPDLIDRCIEFDDKEEIVTLKDLRRFSEQLREESFDMAFIFTVHLKGALMSYLAKIPKRVGFQNWLSRWFLSLGVSKGKLPYERHQSEHFLDLLAKGGVKVNQRIRPKLIPQKTPTSEQILEPFQGPILTIHAGAAYGTAKRWHAEGYTHVAQQFIDKYNGTVLLLGVASEQELNQQIAEALNLPAEQNLCGKTDLKTSISIISSSDYFISNDSGLMHVAAAFEIPQIAVFGPTDVRSSFPHNPKAKTINHKVPCGPCFKHHCPIDHACMVKVTGKQVFALLESLVQTYPAKVNSSSIRP